MSKLCTHLEKCLSEASAIYEHFIKKFWFWLLPSNQLAIGLNVINGELLKTNITTSSEKLQTLDIIPYTLALDTFKTVHKVLRFRENCFQ